MTITIAQVLKKVRDDLEWRGPSGGKMGHIVLTREEAEYFREWSIKLIMERDALVFEKEEERKLCRELVELIGDDVNKDYVCDLEARVKKLEEQ
jgi:hypothetical protein